MLFDEYQIDPRNVITNNNEEEGVITTSSQYNNTNVTIELQSAPTECNEKVSIETGGDEVEQSSFSSGGLFTQSKKQELLKVCVVCSILCFVCF